MPRKRALGPSENKDLPGREPDAKTAPQERQDARDPADSLVSDPKQAAKKNGGWREIEAMREKAALKASLADVWDDDFDLDDEILAELDHTAEYFTQEQDPEDQDFEPDEDLDEDLDEFFDEEEV